MQPRIFDVLHIKATTAAAAAAPAAAVAAAPLIWRPHHAEIQNRSSVRKVLVYIPN